MVGVVGLSSSTTLVAIGIVLSLILNAAILSNGGKTSTYVRTDSNLDMPVDSPTFYVPPGHNSPQQVHITQGDYVGTAVIVTWTTPHALGPNKVTYWSENCKEKKRLLHKNNNYTSGFIHHANISNLEFDTKHYYQLGSGRFKRTFWFETPPKPGPDVPYTFGLIGDIGQTYNSNTTLNHYEKAVLYPGDLSYADTYPFNDNVRWDTWGRFVERSAAYQPWMWSIGNHEVDWAPELGEPIPFKPFTNRFNTPYPASGSTAPYWYSIKRGPAYIIAMNADSAFAKVNRSETPWLIVIMHPPWYNSNAAHYMEGQTMRVVYEKTFVQYKVDVVFAGHERVSNIKYNITNGLCTPEFDPSAPVYITIGDGGNHEGLYIPQPAYSAFREASYGHGVLDIKNRTHAYFAWNRNQDGYAVESDSLWLFNRYWYLRNDSTSF
ncbi:purple acid phosphatase 2-like [Fagus crenata]